MKLDQRQVQHFFLRAGFGQPLGHVQAHIGTSPEKLFESQVQSSRSLKPITVDFQKPRQKGNTPMSPEMKSDLRKARKKAVSQLNINWIMEMAASDAQLLEKMAFFWHDHFACRSDKPEYMQEYLRIIRTNALGNFGELLRGISKSPAMLYYLNNQQNKKASPNENFAREVMELFTLGREGGYTEHDISEAARAFTGWGYNTAGEFVFKKSRHDQRDKTVLGHTGPMDGDDVINILLKQPQTAAYISHKWVKYFLNESGDKLLEKRVADELFRTNYDILSALEVLFTSPRFFQTKHQAMRVKTPIELIAGMQRQLHIRITHGGSLLYLQQIMGQVLFRPPNVSGWPEDGKDWVDSATLMFRINLPQLLFKTALLQNTIESFDDNDQFKVYGQLKKLETTLDVPAMKQTFDQLSTKELATYLLQAKVNHSNRTTDYIEQIISITSKPEFQLC